MCDCVPFALFPYSCNKTSKLGLTRCVWKPRIRLGNSGLQFDRATSGPNGVESHSLKSVNCVNGSRNPRATGFEEYEDYNELMFKKKGKKCLEFEMNQDEAELEKLSKQKNGVDASSDDVPVSSSYLDEKRNRKTGRGLKAEDDMVKIEDVSGVDSKLEELDQRNGREVLKRRRRQTMTRSSMLAKQVISIQSALNLGFVSQLWVDTSSWVVFIVEVRPNLLSSESERFLLEDVTQVGDVVLVQDEGVMESASMIGLETLVGYNVVTPTRRNIGKVRGYTFNINSGAVESLELDSFGISIIPSALVSTYALFVEDVIEVLSDTVVVHEAAASRVQRLSKGLWGSQKVGTSIDELEEYTDLERQPYQYDNDQRTQRCSSRRKSRPKMRDVEDDWELPMDYL